MKMGSDIMENVGNMGLHNQDSVNSFNQANAAADVGVQGTNIGIQQASDAQWGEMMSSGLGAAGSIYGMNQLKGMGSSGC